MNVGIDDEHLQCAIHKQCVGHLIRALFLPAGSRFRITSTFPRFHKEGLHGLYFTFKLITVFMGLPITRVADTVHLRRIIVKFILSLNGIVISWMVASISGTMPIVLSLTFKRCQTAPNVTRVCTYTTSHTCTPTYIAIIIGLTRHKPFANHYVHQLRIIFSNSIIGRVRAAFNELFKKNRVLDSRDQNWLFY